jgi:hypothetical protein
MRDGWTTSSPGLNRSAPSRLSIRALVCMVGKAAQPSRKRPAFHRGKASISAALAFLVNEFRLRYVVLCHDRFLSRCC